MGICTWAVHTEKVVRDLLMSKICEFFDACSTVRLLRKKREYAFDSLECTDRFTCKRGGNLRMPYYCVDVDDGCGEYDELRPKSESRICGLYRDDEYCVNVRCNCHDANKRYVNLNAALKEAKIVRNRAFWAMFGIRVK